MQLPLFQLPEPTELQRLIHARDHQLNCGTLSKNTLAGYAHDWRDFSAWCRRWDREPFPASSETVSLYVTDTLGRGKKVATAVRHVAGVVYFHRVNSLPCPSDASVTALFRAARRQRHEQPVQKRALSIAELRAICHLLAADGTIAAARNRALLLIGFASALRRGNLADLIMDDLEFTDEGLVIHVRWEKQDQEGHGRWIGIPPGTSAETCPVGALRAWLEVRGLHPGAVFTSRNRRAAPGAPLCPAGICHVVQQCVERIGLPGHLYGAHSLRSGFCTTAAEAGASELLISSQSGHKSMEVLRQYFRRRDLWRANAAGMLGL